MRHRNAFLSGASVFAVALGVFAVTGPALATEAKEGIPCVQNTLQTCEMFVTTPGGTGDRAVFKIYQEDGIERKVVFPYGLFRGNIQIRRGDTDGDGQDEFVTVPERGGGPQVRVWSRTGELEASFFGYETTFRGGVNLALGDLDGDGDEEIIIAPRGVGGPNVRVYTFDPGSGSYVLLDWVMAYDASFHGGVQVQTGDVDGDGNGELIVSPRTGAGSIKVYNLVEGALEEMSVFFPFATDFALGLRVRVGDVMGDAQEEIVVTPNEQANPEVKVYGWDGDIFVLLDSFMAYGNPISKSINTGVALRLGNIVGDEHLEIITVGWTDGRAPLIVWQSGDTFRIVANAVLFSGAVRGLNIHTRNVAPDHPTNQQNVTHDEIIVTPRGLGGPQIVVWRYAYNGKSNLQLVRAFFAFHPLFRGETKFDDANE